MPFKKTNDRVEWIPSTNEDIANFNKSLIQESGVVPLTYELKTKVEEALRGVAPSPSANAFVSNNSFTYSIIKNLIKTPPGLVDIVLPVHNSFHLTKKCISLVLKRTHWPFHLYIVDDASDSFTSNKLDEIQEKNSQKITIIRNVKNRGFAASVNRGIKAGNGEYVCLLNSDVFVTDLWLTKMIIAHKADPRNQIVCPATNNTAIVEIPLSPGASYIKTNSVFECFAVRRYPEIMPTGFCYLFPRKLIDKIGYFDESYVSYGEDSDHWYRTIRYAEGARYTRYRAVLADDAYVFHQRSGSFSQLGNDAHQQLRKLASGRFNRIWPEWVQWRKGYDANKSLGNLREKIHPLLLSSVNDKYRVCWVVNSADPCGGMSYIKDVVNELVERGINVKIAVIKVKEDSKESFMGELTVAPVFFNDVESFVKDFNFKIFSAGTVIAATSSIVPAIKLLCEFNSQLRPMLHVQSYEPDLLDYIKPQQEREISKQQSRINFKTFTDLISSSNWITEKLKKELNVEPFATFVPGVDLDLFYPRGRAKGDDRPTVMLPMLGNLDTGFSKVKGYERGLELIQELERLSTENNLDLRILVYGTDSLPTITSAVCLGPIPPERLAKVLGTEVDVFIDPSNIHSYGLPALEALASGVKVFSWDNKGIHEYGDGIVEIFPTNESTTVVANAIIAYLSESINIESYNKEFFSVKAHLEARHSREKSVNEFINVLETRLNVNFVAKKISVVVPHLRKHGGPTTMLAIANELNKLGHSVSVSTVYSDINDEVVSMTELPISLDAANIEPADIYITNSDNPLVDRICQVPNSKKIMLKLSHNSRFKAEEEKGLQQPWDAIVTSTEWLKNACENVTDGWTYPARKATRIGWWNYGFGTFNCPPSSRSYGGETSPIIIGTLIHAHPLKGTKEAIRILGNLYMKYNNRVRFVGVGEIPVQSFTDLPNFQYVQTPSRTEMANVMRQVDIWLGASYTEGLGRMGLEAMSSGCAVVLSDTGSEYAQNEKNCLLYPPGDVDQATLNIDRLINNKELAMSIRQAGYDTASRMADPTECIQTLQKVIVKL